MSSWLNRPVPVPPRPLPSPHKGPFGQQSCLFWAEISLLGGSWDCHEREELGGLSRLQLLGVPCRCWGGGGGHLLHPGVTPCPQVSTGDPTAVSPRGPWRCRASQPCSCIPAWPLHSCPRKSVPEGSPRPPPQWHSLSPLSSSSWATRARLGGSGSSGNGAAPLPLLFPQAAEQQQDHGAGERLFLRAAGSGEAVSEGRAGGRGAAGCGQGFHGGW